MKRLSALLCALVLIAFASTSALADTFNFSFGDTGDAFYGSGVLSGVSNGDGTFTLDSVTGTTTFTSGDGNDVENIAGILAPDTFPVGFFATPNDNLLYFPASHGHPKAFFDQAGLSYSLDSGVYINLFSRNGEFAGQTYYSPFGPQSRGESQSARISVTSATSPVPEPNTLILLGTGFLGLAGIVRRKLAA